MRVRGAAVVPLLALVLVGCSRGNEVAVQPLPPAPSPTEGAPSPPASPSPSASPSPAVDSPRAAAAAASKFYVELGKAFTSLDSAPLRALSSPTCADCSALIASVDREKAAGHHWSGGKIRVLSAEAVPENATRQSVLINYVAGPLVQLDAPAPASPDGTLRVVLEVQVVLEQGNWLVDKIIKVI